MPGGVPTVPVVPDEADFQKWKARQGSVSSPTAPVPDEADFQAWKAKQASPESSHKDLAFRKRQMARGRITDLEAEQTGEGGVMESLAQGAETAINSVPLGGRLMAGARSVGQGIPFKEAARQQNEEISQYKDENPRGSLAMGVAANVPLMLNLPGRLLQGGRVAGAGLGAGAAAAQRLGSTDAEGESVGERLTGTIKDAAIGGGIGYAAPWLAGNPITRTALGAGAGAFVAPENHRLEGAAVGAGLAVSPSSTLNVAGKVAEKVGASGAESTIRNLIETIGTRGVVNKEMQGIDKIAKPLGTMVGAPGGAGQWKVDEARQFLNQSKANYTTARNSPQVLDDPKTLSFINDPDLSKGFAAVDAIRGASRKPLPKGIVGVEFKPRDATPREAVGDFLNRQSGGASRVLAQGGAQKEAATLMGREAMETPQQGLARSALERRGPRVDIPSVPPAPGPYTFAEPVEGTVPDPEALHLLKRIVRDVVDKGFSKESPIPIEDALRLQPKLQALTQHLHDVSPEYKAADRFFQLGKVSEKATDLGYGAAKPAMQNPAASSLGKKDVAGARAFAAKQGHADPAHDAALKAASESGIQQGAKSQLAQQLAQRGVAGGRAGVASAPGFALNAPAAEQRGLALGRQQPAFENVLAQTRAGVAADSPKPGLLSKGVAAMTRGKVHLNAPTDRVQTALASEEGQKILAKLIADPSAYQGTLGRFAKGGSSRQMAEAIAKLLAGSAIGGNP